MSTFMELMSGKMGKAKTVVDRVRVTTSGKMYYRMNGKQVSRSFGTSYIPLFSETMVYIQMNFLSPFSSH